MKLIFDFFFSVLGSDVVYSENAVMDLLVTLGQLSGPKTTIFLAGELRNGDVSLPSSFFPSPFLDLKPCQM